MRPSSSGCAAQTSRPEAADPRFRHAGKAQFDELTILDGAVADDDTAIVVGSAGGSGPFADDGPGPGGRTIDLTRKTPPRPFTNGHTAPVFSVAVGHGQVATASCGRDPAVRVSDLRTGKAVAEVAVPDPGDELWFAVRWLHKTPRLAVLGRGEVFVVDPKRPGDLVAYPPPPERVSILSRQIAVSPDDAGIAAGAVFRAREDAPREAGLLVWKSERADPVAMAIVPPKAADRADWRVRGVTFDRAGQLVAWCRPSGPEVPPGVAEKDVPPAARGVVRLDPQRKTFIPTGMGCSVTTSACAFDPSGEWLAVVGRGQLDPGRADPDATNRWSELRVYHAATARLAYREQVLGRDQLTWVAFSPGGQRLVAATLGGTVHWWDVTRPKD